jgi:hypothetical protein
MKGGYKMNGRKLERIFVVLGVVGLSLFFLATNSHAIPSFARQAGMDCTACHTLWPELTPFGRYFKLTGYVMSKSSKSYEFPPPVAGLLQVSFTHTNKDQPKGSIDKNWATHLASRDNDVFSIPQEASLYYGGRIYDKLGAFIQGTFDGAENKFMLDMTDIRYANNFTLAGKNLIYGFTLNNSPTLQDVWNSTPAFGFPYASSSVAPTPAASTVVEGILDQQVGGLGAYAFWNNMIYTGGAIYHSTKTGIFKPLGVGNRTENVVDDYAPYWRLVLQQQWKNHFLSVGTFGLYAKIFPEAMTSGPSDKFTDIAFDTQYQYIGKKHVFSAHAHWIHESQDLDGSFALGNAAKQSGHLNRFDIHGHYYYRSPIGEFGGSLGFFSITGNSDSLLYSPDPVDGSRTGKPDGNGFIAEIDYLPFGGTRKFFSPKVSLQYTIYNKFNGSHSNYDGFGRDASDNNTLYFLLWFMF